MKKTIAAAFTLGVFASTAQASVMAVIDSGTDLKHKELASKAWVNALEIEANDRDEDKNGYPDDVNGWNFAENNNQLVDYKYLPLLTPDMKRFFDIQVKYYLGKASKEDVDWVRAKIEDKQFIKNAQTYGNFMHGTHVAGITAKNNADVKLLGVKLIPTEVGLPGDKEGEDGSNGGEAPSVTPSASVVNIADLVKPAANGTILTPALKMALTYVAKEQAKTMFEIVSYINKNKADVANCSFGTSFEMAKGIAESVFEYVLKRKPTDAEASEVANAFLGEMLRQGKQYLAKAPSTLFVIAAGNESSDNDKFPASPTNIEADNRISVAATIGNVAIAPFSNYGAAQVDVAAPGVGILSTVPGNEYIAVNGTSQATPFVAQVAAAMKDVNPKLAPKDLKQMIMGTVDVKVFLQGKVKSSGVVNRERAVRAAELAKTMTVAEAVAKAKSDIADVPNYAPKGMSFLAMRSMDSVLAKKLVMPLPSQITIRK